MEEWKEYKARDFCSAVTDGTHDSPKPTTEGHYLITSKHLKNNRIDFSSANQISEEDYQKVILRSAVEQYDILFSMIGTIGNIVQVKQSHVDFAVKNMGIFKMGKNSLRSTWLYYWLNSNYSKEYINQRLAGSTQSYMTLDSLRTFPVLYPGDNNAQTIVSILKSLDDKIEVNRRINENLEQQAQALFKSWFVDFEPFKNGEFVESELGMIPKGWRVGAIGDYCKVRSGYAFKSSWWSNSGIPVVKIKNITDDGRLDMTDSSFVSNEHADLAKEFQTKVGDLLIAMTGATIGKFCIVHSNNKLCVNQRVGKFFLGENPLKKMPFVYYNLRRPNVFEEIVRRGQGSAQPNISGKDIETISIIYPSEEIISQFNILLYSLFEKIICNLQESRRLATLRDNLLPKLMSGELKVNEIVS